ncbi:hypothetical protein [Streptomyces sp. CS62]|uniref:hypothetical protein n=1 Tax=Streptomyces sp. CS62 TaxID=3119268 RepID=UPI002F93B6D0
MHRTDLVRIRELITGAGGTVLGAVVHAPLPVEKRGRGKSKGAPAAAPPAPAPRPQQPAGPRQGAAEQHIPGDGTDTVALRTVRMGNR